MRLSRGKTAAHFFRIMRYIERLTDSGVVWRGLGAVRRPAAV
jgi:hypothetical protein